MQFDKNESWNVKKVIPDVPKQGSKGPLRTCASLNDLPDSSFHQMTASRRMNSMQYMFCSARVELDGIYYDFDQDLLIDKKQ